jgi:hypothetical protein
MLTDIDKYHVQVAINHLEVIISRDIKILTYVSKIKKIMANLFSAFKKIIKKYKNFAREKLIKFSENQNEF